MIDRILTLTLGKNSDDAAIANYFKILQYRDRFLRGEISFLDFCDVCDQYGVDIDHYVGCIEFNLQCLGLL